MRAQSAPEGPARVEFTVQFSRGPKGQRRAREAPEQPDPTHAPGSVAAPSKVASVSLPKITRLLVLGHHFERLVREGAVKDYAEIARLTGLTRARVTQIVNLTLLAPDIQERVVSLGEGASLKGRAGERQFREIVAAPSWADQRHAMGTCERVPSNPTA